ncbi:hypothetical protein DAI22_11g143500 [Oryza sativa Japonica Group]|nr:hypothetical protein DAI22_11g143500 [Oryza sativa Japonica Group]
MVARAGAKVATPPSPWPAGSMRRSSRGKGRRAAVASARCKRGRQASGTTVRMPPPPPSANIEVKHQQRKYDLWMNSWNFYQCSAGLQKNKLYP